jgi:FKBP-type peptidyl-prolyl cis-trans isomerase FklB
MKKILVLSLVILASASFTTIDAQRKKAAKNVAAPVSTVMPVIIVSSSDSVSYAAGMAMTNGLIPYLTQQLKVDTAYMADFVGGLKESLSKGSDAKFKAYSAGMQIAQMLQERMIPGVSGEFKDSPDSINKDLFVKGFLASLQKDSSVYSNAKAEKFYRDRMTIDKAAKTEKLYGANRRAGEAFLAANAKKDSVVTLTDGLQYKVLVMGKGAKPKPTDRVVVKYEGRLIDGTIFDSSYKRKDPTNTFRADQVIKGWTEALTMMPVGSTWELYIPQNLAYGEREAGQIKPFSALIFKVELVGIDQPKTDAKAQPVAPKTKMKAPRAKK